MKPELSIVVPCHNEAPNVAALAARIVAAFAYGAPEFEIILVDDGSTDGTWDEIQKVVGRLAPVTRGFRHQIRAGQSAALWTGLKASRAPLLATLDGDLQNDPADLPAMLRQLSSCDMVCGVRTKRMDSLSRWLSSRIARLATRTVLRVDFRDPGCNLRVFKRSVLQDLPAFDGLHRFLPILAQAAGARVIETDVAHHPRIAGRSHYGITNRLGRGLRDLAIMRWYLTRQIKPIPTLEVPAVLGPGFNSVESPGPDAYSEPEPLKSVPAGQTPP